MKLNEAFPSNYVTAADLGGKDVTLTIEDVTMQELGQGHDKENKLCIAFVGKQKAMVCNRTNANTIAKLYGDDTDNWLGQKITIGPREVEFKGEMVWAIRVSLLKPAAAKPAVAKPVAIAQMVNPNDGEVDDGNDILF